MQKTVSKAPVIDAPGKTILPWRNSTLSNAHFQFVPAVNYNSQINRHLSVLATGYPWKRWQERCHVVTREQ